jgi:hypothetical protein
MRSKAHINIGAVLALLAGIALFSSGCTIPIYMYPVIGTLNVGEKLPVEAALLITDATRNYIVNGYPDNYRGGTRPHIFPLGYALETASVQAFSQIFEKVDLVRTAEEARKYPICIEPKIEEFHFRHDQEDILLVLVDHSVSKMRIRATLSSGDTVLWTKSVESPEQKAGSSIQVKFDDAGACGRAASDAMVYSISKIAQAIAEDDTLRQYIEKSNVR